jgi:aspartate ammonia-lyase
MSGPVALTGPGAGGPDAGDGELSGGEMRWEHDLLGELEVPAMVLYGVHTARALRNFPSLGVTVGEVPEFARAMGMVKLAASRANVACGALSPELAEAIDAACAELIDGDARLGEALVVPLLQGGAGTSTNMNVNEVIANRALEHLGQDLGDYELCHPNDHVNRSQSTNDVYPTALRVALLLRHRLVRSQLERLVHGLDAAAARFSEIPKLARTQLRDAVPMTVSDEFLAWADGCRAALGYLEHACESLLEVNLGGTAVGTGLAAPPAYADAVVSELATIAAIPVRRAQRPISATTDSSGLLAYSSALRTAAVAVGKLANDLRLLSSGPRTGLQELELPPVQAGSSMMPGKVNPVVPEYANQASFRIRGLDTTVVLALDAAQLQLGAMLPVAAGALFEAQDLLGAAAVALAHRCIDQIEINESQTRDNAREGLGEVSVLAATVGYEESSRLALHAEQDGVAPASVLGARDSGPADPGGAA